jgi:hypothetical protein
MPPLSQMFSPNKSMGIRNYDGRRVGIRVPTSREVELGLSMVE